jgi:ABC-type dipeptide/oligopeptide/nickel transport system permease component
MGLREYIIRRLILLVPIMFGVVILIFAVLQLIPPESRASLYITDPKQFQHVQDVIAQYGLNDPVYIQFGRWLSEIFKGNFGYSEYFGEPVTTGLLARLPATLEISIFAAPLIILFGIWFGTAAAVHRDKMPDHVSRILSILGTSLPTFFFGLLMIAIFVAQLRWTTTGRATNLGTVLLAIRRGTYHPYTGLFTVDSLLNGDFMLFLDAIKHMILPVMVLVFINSAVMVRVTRSSMLEALSKTYIVAARAKGLSRKETIYKHARRNALIPVVTMSGMMVGGMLTGLVITETVFNFPGVGNYAAAGASHFDVSIVAAYAMFSAVVFVIANLLVDILYGYIDPRIRLG